MRPETTAAAPTTFQTRCAYVIVWRRRWWRGWRRVRRGRTHPDILWAPPMQRPRAEDVKKAASAAIKLDDRPYELRFKLSDMILREPPPEFASDELRLRDALKELPEGSPEAAYLKADLAALVLESGYGSRPPDADAREEGLKLIDE